MNNKIIIISSILILILMIIFIKLITPSEEDIIISGNIKSILIKESFTGEFRVNDISELLKFKENFDIEIPIYCSKINSIELNKNSFIKLNIETTNGYYAYQLDKSKKIINKTYQPNAKNQLFEDYLDIQYTCEDYMIDDYNNRIKNLK
jgi:hypothetical protein